MKNFALVAILAAMMAMGAIVSACGGGSEPAKSPDSAGSASAAGSESAAPAGSASAAPK